MTRATHTLALPPPSSSPCLWPRHPGLDAVARHRAASKALVALGIVVLARTGILSFGQGLFYATGGYGVALNANEWGLTDAVVHVRSARPAAACSPHHRPLIARYTGIFFACLTLALSMVLYGALVKTPSSRLRRLQRRPADAVRSRLRRSARGGLHCSTPSPWSPPGLAASSPPSCSARSSGSPASRAREQPAGRISRHPRPTAIVTVNFVIAAVIRRRQRRAGADGARHNRSGVRLLDDLRRVRLRRGAGRNAERRGGVRRRADAGAGALLLQPLPAEHLSARLGLFLLAVILFWPRGIGTLWSGRKRRRPADAVADEGGAA